MSTEQQRTRILARSMAILAVMIPAQGIGTAVVGAFVDPSASPFVIFIALTLCMAIALVSLVLFRQFPLPAWTWDRVLALIGMNCATAGAWVLFYIAVTLIPSSAATVLEAGIGPIVMVAAGSFGVTQRASKNELITSVIVTVLVIMTTGYIFFDHDGAPLGQVMGAIFALVAGVGTVFNILISRRCTQLGISPMMINAFRFPLAILVTGGLCLMVPVSFASHPWLDPSMYIIALCAIAIPMLGMQFGVSHAPAFWSAILLSCLPAIVFATQSLLTGVIDVPLLVLTLAVVVVSMTGAVIQHIRRHSDAISVGVRVSG